MWFLFLYFGHQPYDGTEKWEQIVFKKKMGDGCQKKNKIK